MRGYALVALAAVLWALIGPVAKFAFAAGMQPLEVSFWRTILGWSLFAAQAAARGQTRVDARDLPALAAFGVLGVGGLFGFYTLAVQAGGAALASVLLYTAPAWVALLSRLVLGETLGGVKLLAVAMTILGAAGVAGLGPGAEVNGPALAFGLASGFSYALYYIFGKRYGQRYATPTLLLYAMPAGAAAMLPFLGLGEPARLLDHPPAAWAAVAVIGLFSTFFSYTVYYAGLRTLEATRASVVATLEPLAAGVLAYLLWGETFTPLGYAGATLILGAVLLTILGSRGGGRERPGRQHGCEPRRADAPVPEAGR